MESVVRFVEALVSIFADAGLWLIFGFLIAGFLHTFISRDLLARHLGKPGIGSVIKATLIGIPLPLCSCSVIPAAASLKQSGASKGAAAAFAVSTPEIDVPAASLTWAMLGPVMAIARILAAGISAIVAGVLIDATDKRDVSSELPLAQPEPVSSCCQSSVKKAEQTSFGTKLLGAVRYGFITLPADLVNWLLLGLMISAAVTAFVPDTWLSGTIGTGFVAMLIAMGFGLVVYVCATGSTPMAAALVAKGLGPGAALVFLLAGPATNPATMAWILKDLGVKALAVYLLSIAGVAIASGLMLDWFLRDGWFPAGAVSTHQMGNQSTLAAVGGSLLMALLTYALVRKIQKRFEKKAPASSKGSCCSKS